MPSLIAYLQLGHETDCVGRLVNVNWSKGGAHPYSYEANDVRTDMCPRPHPHAPAALHTAVAVWLSLRVLQQSLQPYSTRLDDLRGFGCDWVCKGGEEALDAGAGLSGCVSMRKSATRWMPSGLMPDNRSSNSCTMPPCKSASRTCIVCWQ